MNVAPCQANCGRLADEGNFLCATCRQARTTARAYVCGCGKPRSVITASKTKTTWLTCSHCDKPCAYTKPTCPDCFNLHHAGEK